MTHPFPQLNWTPCGELPDCYRRVVVLHRVRPWCRFNEIVVGWWNTEEWRRDDSHYAHGKIYQPICWRDIEFPK
jgi:hypothetical protein